VVKRLKDDRDAQIQSAWVTKLCTAVPNIWSTLIAVCYIHTKMCISSCVLSRKHWILWGSQVIPRGVSPQHGTCFMSALWNLEFGCGSCIFGKFVNPLDSNSYAQFGVNKSLKQCECEYVLQLPDVTTAICLRRSYKYVHQQTWQYRNLQLPAAPMYCCHSTTQPTAEQDTQL